ncbi:alpha-l-arabinofuranosidase b [Stylonychia lemnae]|uniref:Alpha-l-arabinofuranosidase b n=1 Tax=Stylonychia lemnae TaxID=5949 RepID=A0A078AMK8_STYLE|nr:alpha-l-arabinofuranosidase b [Stylonychia lemnae]|eukprot:CDW83161.1 alpha-l-arabinofuranosidase b [Stylonychia lemnae]
MAFIPKIQNPFKFKKLAFGLLGLAAISAVLFLTLEQNIQSESEGATFLARDDFDILPFSLGSLVSLQCFYPRGYFLRHLNGMFLAQEMRDDEDYRLSASLILDYGLTGENTVSIRSFNMPDYYLRIGTQNLIKLQQIDHSDPNFRADATFKVKRGLIDPNLISFESINRPDVYIRQDDDQIRAQKRQNNYQFKDDATWVISDSLVEVDYIGISYFKEQANITILPDLIVQDTLIDNSQGSQPMIQFNNEIINTNSSTEYFEQLQGFGLQIGETYKVSARTPIVDMNGQIFYTSKQIRNWTYGNVNTKYSEFAYETSLIISEFSTMNATYIVKQARIRIPFEATVHLKDATLTQFFTGVWVGIVSYDYGVNRIIKSFSPDGLEIQQ